MFFLTIIPENSAWDLKVKMGSSLTVHHHQVIMLPQWELYKFLHRYRFCRPNATVTPVQTH